VIAEFKMVLKGNTPEFHRSWNRVNGACQSFPNCFSE